MEAERAVAQQGVLGLDVAAKPTGPAELPLVSTNEGSGTGRLFLFVMDTNTIETGTDSRAMESRVSASVAR